MRIELIEKASCIVIALEYPWHSRSSGQRASNRATDVVDRIVEDFGGGSDEGLGRCLRVEGGLARLLLCCGCLVEAFTSRAVCVRRWSSCSWVAYGIACRHGVLELTEICVDVTAVLESRVFETREVRDDEERLAMVAVCVCVCVSVSKDSISATNDHRPPG